MTTSQEKDSDSVGRRAFLTRGTLLAGGAVASVAALTATEERVLAQTSPVALRTQLQLVRRHENDHVAFLRTALGPAARPMPTFQNLNTTSLFQFLTLSRVLENVGVAAYLGAAPAIFDRGTLAAAASIATIEARHAGFLNSLTSRASTENAFGQELSFERAGTIEEVVNAASPYIASLNGGPPLTFSATPSASNDIAILNFALALEFLEAEYYNLNVPRYYP